MDEKSVNRSYSTRAQAANKACGLSPALHLVFSGPAPYFYPAAVPNCRLTVKE